MSMMTSLQGAGSFFLYFGVALAAEAAFIALYMAITPHHEWSLIKQGNVAASISLAGASIGFTLPLASAIIHSISLLDMAVWSGVALVVQVAAFWLVDLLIRGLSLRIEQGNVAAGITLAGASLVIGMINAASMSY